MNSQLHKVDSKKYTWLYKLKYTFYMLLMSFSLVIVYTVVLDLVSTSTLSKPSVFRLFRENFFFSNIENPIFPHIIWYMLFEELAFRKSLVIWVKNLIMSLALLLYISFISFIDESFMLFIYSSYVLLLIVIYKKENSNKWSQRINIIFSLVALAVFHASKFVTEHTDTIDLFLIYIIPILMIGGVLAHLRLKFNSYWSFSLYFVIVLMSNIL